MVVLLRTLRLTSALVFIPAEKLELVMTLQQMSEAAEHCLLCE